MLKIASLCLRVFNAVFSILRMAIDATALDRALGSSLLPSALWLSFESLNQVPLRV